MSSVSSRRKGLDLMTFNFNSLFGGDCLTVLLTRRRRRRWCFFVDWGLTQLDWTGLCVAVANTIQ